MMCLAGINVVVVKVHQTVLRKKIALRSRCLRDLFPFVAKS